MKRVFFLIFTGLLLTAASCKKDVLKPGQVYHSDELDIEFVDFNDSRCPLGAQCIWEGEAVVFLKVSSASSSADITLTNPGADTTLFGHRIEFVDLKPYPEEGKKKKAKYKKLTLNVIKL